MVLGDRFAGGYHLETLWSQPWKPLLLKIDLDTICGRRVLIEGFSDGKAGILSFRSESFMLFARADKFKGDWVPVKTGVIE
jgi:hypothetical protein